MKFQNMDVWYIAENVQTAIADRAADKDYPYFQEPNTGRVSFIRKKHALKVAKYLGIEESRIYHGMIKFVID